jgi:hypothetical protein
VGVQIYELTPTRRWFVFVAFDASVFLQKLSNTYTVHACSCCFSCCCCCSVLAAWMGWAIGIVRETQGFSLCLYVCLSRTQTLTVAVRVWAGRAQVVIPVVAVTLLLIMSVITYYVTRALVRPLKLASKQILAAAKLDMQTTATAPAAGFHVQELDDMTQGTHTHTHRHTHTCTHIEWHIDSYITPQPCPLAKWNLYMYVVVHLSLSLSLSLSLCLLLLFVLGVGGDCSTGCDAF